MVISFGLIHGIGGASVALNLATIAYIGDISTPETKVNMYYLGFYLSFIYLYLILRKFQTVSKLSGRINSIQ